MIIFTDLDGTLLDHESYSFAPAAQALAQIRARNIPLIFATSKTAAEIAPLRDATGIFMPAIVENGAGVDWPGRQDDDNDEVYQHIRASLDAMPASLRRRFRGFADMDPAEIDALTGLGAGLCAARRRRYSEPGVFSGSETDREAFLYHLATCGLLAVQGGRFLTISQGVSKADRVADIVGWWRERHVDGRPITLALGDAENDIDLLEAADLAVVVANSSHAPLRPLAGEAAGRVVRTREEGPAGWNGAVLSFLEDPETFAERYRP
jgi:mannosyl-3-phosphoglycerate phosphatase